MVKRPAARTRWTRREWIIGLGGIALGGCAAPWARPTEKQEGYRQARGHVLSQTEERFLEVLERRAFRFFWEAADGMTGQVRDRTDADGLDEREIGSIAATGFGLTALCIGHERGFHDRAEIVERVRTTLRWLANNQPHVRGFFHHFFNVRTGERIWDSEISSIDTAILLCGALTCRHHFKQDREIVRLAGALFDRADWNWMRNGRTTLCHGWKPESGFLQARWDRYSELMMLYLLGLGSATHPLPRESWTSWSRPVMEYRGYRYVSADDPLFVHQYSHAWFDFRGWNDRGVDWFENSVVATRAHRQFCIDLQDRFPRYGEDLWGITASDSQTGYQAWGGPPAIGRLDGSIVPCAAAGSLPFLPVECLHTLLHQRESYGDRIWKRYGFVDAFNPHTKWTNPDVIGINVGISMLMAENLRTEFVWRTLALGVSP